MKQTLCFHLIRQTTKWLLSSKIEKFAFIQRQICILLGKNTYNYTEGVLATCSKYWSGAHSHGWINNIIGSYITDVEVSRFNRDAKQNINMKLLAQKNTSNEKFFLRVPTRRKYSRKFFVALEVWEQFRNFAPCLHIT